MVETITLSIPAVDVLGEQLNLNVRQYPFEFPRLGASAEERERIVHQVWEELEAAGHARSGRPEPEVEDALYLLSGSEVSIAAAGLLDVRAGYRLAARVVATGEVGVSGVIDGRGMLRMDFLAPDDLPETSAGLLPDAPRGAGSAVSAAVERPPSRQGPPAVSDTEGLRAVEAITARPKFRIGHFLVSGAERRRRGEGGNLPSLTWFDNDQGRYAMIGDAETLSCGPTDKGGIAGQLGDMLDRIRAG